MLGESISIRKKGSEASKEVHIDCYKNKNLQYTVAKIFDKNTCYDIFQEIMADNFGISDQKTIK